MGFRARSDIVGVVVHVFHTDTIVKRLIYVQPGDFKTSNGVNKSIERFRVNVALTVRSLCLVSFCTELPCLVSIATN